MQPKIHIDQTSAISTSKMVKKIPKHITLILNETDTIFFLDINSSIVPRESEEGEAAAADNRLYEYLTEGKGRNRKVATTGVQTLPLLMKTRHTEPVPYEFRDNSAFASNWEMYDTYKEDSPRFEREDFAGITTEPPSDEGESEASEDHRLIEELREDYRSFEEREMEKLSENENFFDAALVIERLLANNCYNEQQKHFKGLVEEEAAVEEEVRYDYKLELLWTFANEDTRSRCVTGISFNPITEDILAVGYGKYYFQDRKSTGVVMVWNIKNPKQPEREYYFRYPVTSLAFSNTNPNFLAVGFYNGELKILDVSRRELKVFREDTTSFEPVWDIAWLPVEEIDGNEYFLACFGDGRICKFHITDTQLERVPMMRIAKVEGRLRGLEAGQMFEGNEASSTRFIPTRCLRLHSDVYFVGTSEGVVHRCTSKYCDQHLDMFKAHEGAVHALKFSPFVDRVFASCGDDFLTCLWVEGVDVPLITSRYCMEPVLDIDWSPSHSTVLITLQGMDVFLWDLQRKMHSPQSQTKSPTNSRNTLCRFTRSGRCLLVGDVDGNVHIFSVKDLPHPAFFQENLFFQSLKNILNTKPDLVSRLEKLNNKRLTLI